jgi:hypothetical protein
MDRREQLEQAAELELWAQRELRELMGQPEIPDYLAQRGWLVVREIPAPQVLSALLEQQVRQVQRAYKVRRAQVVRLALQDRPELDQRVVQARRVQRDRLEPRAQAVKPY